MSRNNRKNKKEKQVTTSTEKKKLKYLFLLDRSSSMHSVRSQTIANVNEQFSVIREAAKQNNIDATITLQLFSQKYVSAGESHDSWFEYVFINKNVNEIEDITEKDYIPNGGTPLQDSIGYGVTKLQEVLGDELGQSNVNVLVTIFTDGEENSSVKFKREDIEKMIKHLSEDGKYVFTFIGAGGIAAVQRTSQGFGIAASNTVAYSNDIKGHTLVGSSLRSSTARYMTSYASGDDVTLDFFAAPSADKMEEVIEKKKKHLDKKEVDKV